jgi:3-deoxy-manno-octulosonate cytidylyltransferase (CMP-KDO synthetase)
MKFIGIIPARYKSTRFPGKPLAMLNGKPVIQWVYENAAMALNEVWVATDDDSIYNAVKAFGGRPVKTLSTHHSGTDRCAEAALLLSRNTEFDVVINIQGDEPFIRVEQISALASGFDRDTEIATLIKKIETTEELFNPNRPKVVIDKNNNALYFSRSPIPFVRGEKEGNWLLTTNFWVHIGMYAYKKNILQQITRLKPGILERAEALEQLRWLENGYKIKTAVTEFQSIGIDTPEDLVKAEELLEKPEKNN